VVINYYLKIFFKVYSCVDGQLLFSLEGHTASVQRCMFFHHNHQRLLTSSLDGTLKVWAVPFLYHFYFIIDVIVWITLILIDHSLMLLAR